MGVGQRQFSKPVVAALGVTAVSSRNIPDVILQQ
jgi:hypothetical protein